jgi:hypothetical protein
MTTASTLSGGAQAAAVRNLIVVQASGGNANLGGARFAILDGSHQFLLASGSNEQAVLLVALAKLPTGNTVTIQGGNRGRCRTRAPGVYETLEALSDDPHIEPGRIAAA